MLLELQEFVDNAHAAIEQIEAELSWVDISGQWDKTFDAYEQMTELLKRTLAVHQSWTDSLENA